MNKEYPGALGSAAKDIPVAQFHGTRDDVVRFTWGQNRRVHSLLCAAPGLEMIETSMSSPMAGVYRAGTLALHAYEGC